MLRPSAALLALSLTSLAAAATWKPVDPEELKERTPKVEQGADAEALFWEVHVVDEMERHERRAVLSNYIRVKIYNNRGRDRFSTVDLPFRFDTHIDEIEGRTIHSDGTVIELSQDAIHETESKTGLVTTRRKSFPLPAVEPGSIIEYRWRETRGNRLGSIRMDFQRDLPIRIVRYLLKPYEFSPEDKPIPQGGINRGPVRAATAQATTKRSVAPAASATVEQDYQLSREARGTPGMAIQDFQCKRTALVKRGEYYETSMENVPAFREEPHMPPADQLRAWSLLYYHTTDDGDPVKFWAEFGRNRSNYYSQHIRVSKQIRSLAAEIVSGKNTPQTKLALLSDFCRSKIRNLGTDAVTAEERTDAHKEDQSYKTPDDLLKEGVGTANNIRYLMASLATAAGFEARIALLPDRRQIYFDRSFTNSYFLTGQVVAVKLPDGWHFYDPAGTYVPHDLLAWHHEAVPALITDPKEPFFQVTPVSAVTQSSKENSGVFRVLEDGTLEGDGAMVYTGHEGAVMKERSERQSAEEREEAFKKTLLSRLNTAEISNIQIENATDIEKPFTYRFHIRIPAYAQRTGKRLFFAPALFQQGEAPLFLVKERKYPIAFSFPRNESDQFTFHLPEGFTLADTDIPAAVPIGDAGQYEVAARLVDGNTLVYSRKFTLGAEGRLLFPVAAYPAIKGVFDIIAMSDAFTLTLEEQATRKVP